MKASAGIHRLGYFALLIVCGVALAAAVFLLVDTRYDVGSAMRLDEPLRLVSPAATPEQLRSAGNFVATRLPEDWLDLTIDGSTVWYRFDIALSAPGNRLWAVYIPSLDMVGSVFVNGVHVGGPATLAAPIPRTWNVPHLHSVPSGVIQQGHNEILVRVQANGAWGRLTEIYFGPH